MEHVYIKKNIFLFFLDMCMVFEVSGCNLLSFIKDFTYNQKDVVVPLHLLKKIAIHVYLFYIFNKCSCYKDLFIFMIFVG